MRRGQRCGRESMLNRPRKGTPTTSKIDIREKYLKGEKRVGEIFCLDVLVSCKRKRPQHADLAMLERLRACSRRCMQTVAEVVAVRSCKMTACQSVNVVEWCYRSIRTARLRPSQAGKPVPLHGPPSRNSVSTAHVPQTLTMCQVIGHSSSIIKPKTPLLTSPQPPESADPLIPGS